MANVALDGSRVKYGLAVLLVLGGYALPQFVGSYPLFVIATACVLMVFTATWDFFSGITHYISFGHMFLVGLAGYTSAIVNSELGVPLLLSVLIATVVTGLLGTLIIAGPSLRLSGIYFVTLTLVLPFILQKLVIIFSETTGGVAGYTFLSPLAPAITDLIPLDAPSDVLQYYAILTAFVVVTTLLVVITKSEMGNVLRAIHQDELLLATQGIDPTRFKIVSFGISATFLGFAASLWTHYQLTLAPSSHLSVGIQIDIIVAAIIGGLGTIVGPVLGMLLLRLVEELLKNFEEITVFTDVLGIEIVEFRRLLTMVVALGFFYFYPSGIYPRIRFALERTEAIVFSGPADESGVDE